MVTNNIAIKNDINEHQFDQASVRAASKAAPEQRQGSAREAQEQRQYSPPAGGSQVKQFLDITLSLSGREGGSASSTP